LIGDLFTSWKRSLKTLEASERSLEATGRSMKASLEGYWTPIREGERRQLKARRRPTKKDLKSPRGSERAR